MTIDADGERTEIPGAFGEELEALRRHERA
jgi:hypothetical protein